MGYVDRALRIANENARAKKRKNSRAKGACGERECAKFLTSIGFPCERMGRNGRTAEDLDCKALANLHIECKRNEDIDIGTEALTRAFAQAISDAPKGKRPIVLWRRNGSRAWRMTYMSDGVIVTAHTQSWILSRMNQEVSRPAPTESEER